MKWIIVPILKSTPSLSIQSESLSVKLDKIDNRRVSHSYQAHSNPPPNKQTLPKLSIREALHEESLGRICKLGMFYRRAKINERRHMNIIIILTCVDLRNLGTLCFVFH